MVNWSTVCLAKQKGGLDIRGLTNLNRVLLSKWSWRFANERDSLWRFVIGTKFGEDEGGWCTRVPNGPYDTGLWKEIRKDWEILRPRVAFIVGNGRRVQFWKDAWCGEVALCTLFPSLFALAVHKEASVVDTWDCSRDVRGWSPHFIRLFNDWELEEVERFFLFLPNKKVLHTLEDKIFLREAKGGLFSVSFVYQHLFDIEAHLFPSKLIWNSKVPTKVGFFVWEASWGRILTLDQLKRRDRALANRCFLCKEEEETIEHLLCTVQ